MLDEVGGTHIWSRLGRQQLCNYSPRPSAELPELSPVRRTVDRTVTCPPGCRQNCHLSAGLLTELSPVRRAADRTVTCPPGCRQNCFLSAGLLTELSPVRRAADRTVTCPPRGCPLWRPSSRSCRRRRRPCTSPSGSSCRRCRPRRSRWRFCRTRSR